MLSECVSVGSSNGTRRLFVVGGLLAVLSLLMIPGCSQDQPGAKSCSGHTDCQVGEVCGANDTCVVETNCEFCEGVDELVCIENEDHPDGVCSKPECESASDCPKPGEVCTQSGICSDAECDENSDCPMGEICNFVDQCAPASDTGLPADTGTPDDDLADGGQPEVGQNDGGMLDGEEGGDGGSCEEVNECPPNEGSESEHWNSEYCSCVECLNDDHCSGDQECRDGSCGVACTETCSGGGGSDQCSDDQPYCISECCVECIGAMDCPDDELCVDDECTPSGTDGDCSEGDCPIDHTCNTDTGKCEREQSNQECSQSDPSCPSGETCNPQTGQCEPVSGGQSCGSCNAGCTCPGSATCDTTLFMCTGCSLGSCPDGQTCVPASFFSSLPDFCM